MKSTLKNAALLSLGVALLSSAAFAVEDVRDVRAKEDQVRAAQEAQANGARVQDINSSNDRMATANALAQGSSPAAQIAAKIVAGQSHQDLPAAGVSSFQADISSGLAQGKSADQALNDALKARGSNLEDFASVDKGCGE